MDDRLRSIIVRFIKFAKEHIVGRDLNTSVFPIDLWTKMAQAGLFAFDENEQKSGVFLSLSIAAEALVEAGGNLGMALSWLMQRIIAENFIKRFGTVRQQASVGLSTGEKIFCFAVSEPETGAHPKYLKTTAKLSGDRYILNGQKTYLTNGPIADMFIVVAITGEVDSRKSFSAFLVPKDTPGLTITSMELPFLKPAPHGTLILEDSPVSAKNVLGKEGRAFQDLVEPFRDLEDTLMMGPSVGAMQNQLDQFIQLSKASGAPDTAAGAIGHMYALITVERLLAHEAARMLDKNARGAELTSLLLVFKTLANQFHTFTEEIISKDDADAAFSVLRNDFFQSIHIAERVARIKQKKLGETLLGGDEKS
jgi:alkylation response protein AidB-like acyl-CoA dehydrogenase